MDETGMKVLESILEQQLPVAGNPILLRADAHERGAIIGGEDLRHVSQMLRQFAGASVEIYEAEAVPEIEAKTHKSMIGHPEMRFGLHPARTEQPAVEIVGPAMVGTNDRTTAPASR